MNDRYTVVRAIGKGAQAKVYLAWDANLACWRAMKMLAPQFLDDAAVRARFEGEATMMARFAHRNVMPVVDVEIDSRYPYLVMDLSRGGSVIDWMRRNGPMPARMALGVVVGCCRALEYTHAQGIVHRDVKPHNILIHEDARPILTDFGIARAEDAAQLTANGAAMGTFAFMPPEQRADAHSVTELADVYAMGATLYTMLTARTSTELFLADTKDKMLDGIPEPLRPVLLTACRYEPDQRYPTIVAMREALEAAIDALPEDPPSAPLFEERIVLPGSVPLFLDPDSGVEDLARSLAPAEEMATTLYSPADAARARTGRTDPSGSEPSRSDPGGRSDSGRSDPGRGSRTDPGKGTNPGGRSNAGATNPGRTIEDLAAAIPYTMPSIRGRKSVPPTTDPRADGPLPDYLEASAGPEKRVVEVVGTKPSPTPVSRPTLPGRSTIPPASAEGEVSVPRASDLTTRTPVPESRSLVFTTLRLLIPALAAAALVFVVVGGLGVFSVRTKSSARADRDRAASSLVTEVDRAQGLASTLGQLGGDAQALEASYFVFKDAEDDGRVRAASDFADLAVREADRAGPRARSDAQVVSLRKRAREAEDAEARFQAARQSLVGRLTGSLGTR